MLRDRSGNVYDEARDNPNADSQCYHIDFFQSRTPPLGPDEGGALWFANARLQITILVIVVRSKDKRPPELHLYYYHYDYYCSHCLKHSAAFVLFCLQDLRTKINGSAAWRLKKRMRNNACSPPWVLARPGGFKNGWEIMFAAPHGSSAAWRLQKSMGNNVFSSPMGPRAAWKLRKRMRNNVCSSSWVPGRPGGFKNECEIMFAAHHWSQRVLEASKTHWK
jgi:hypothetical protein